MTDWVLVKNVPGGYEMRCERCGDTYTPVLPCAVEVFVAISRAYAKVHKTCPAPKARS